ncbi:carbohydrate porin [Silvimonas amylolytica]|nr:carbohydrate porin [Silvimonas amylolytica]
MKLKTTRIAALICLIYGTQSWAADATTQANSAARQAQDAATQVEALKQALAQAQTAAAQAQEAAAQAQAAAVQAQASAVPAAGPANTSAANQSAVGTVTSNGYFRAGFGEAGKGGSMECFGVGYAKFRFGNECDAYARIGLHSPIYNQSNGAVWSAHASLLATAPYSDWGGNKISFAEMYTDVARWGDGPLKGASLWVGRRYYDRPDIYLLDYKYQQGDGDGGGIENVDTGWAGSKFSYALIRPRDGNNNGRTWLENLFKLSGLKAGPGAFTFNAGLTAGWKSDDTTMAQTDASGNTVLTTTPTKSTASGWYLSALYKHPVADWGNNTVGIQYGRGANANGNFGQVLQNATASDATFQIFSTAALDIPNSKWTALAAVVYRQDQYKYANNGDDKWFSAGLHPQYHFNDMFGLATDFGYQSYKPDSTGKTETLGKATVALTAAAGRSALARPEMRVFYTYARWNDAARNDRNNFMNQANGKTQSVDANATNGSSFGVQVESWW